MLATPGRTPPWASAVALFLVQEAFEGSLHASVPRCTAIAVTARILSLTDQSMLQPEAAWWSTALVNGCRALVSVAQAAAQAGTEPLLLCRALCALQALLHIPLADSSEDAREVNQT